MIINTHGSWFKFEEVAKTKFEIGKTYKIEVDGLCEFAISKNKPTIGIVTNEINYTKNETNTLWVKTK